MNNSAATSGDSQRTGTKTQAFRIDIIKNGRPSDYCANLTRVPLGSHWSGETDLAWCLNLLTPLRDWLEIHGALTPGSGVLVRAVPENIRPDLLDDELANGGTVLATRSLRTVIGGHPPAAATAG